MHIRFKVREEIGVFHLLSITLLKRNNDVTPVLTEIKFTIRCTDWDSDPYGGLTDQLHTEKSILVEKQHSQYYGIGGCIRKIPRMSKGVLYSGPRPPNSTLLHGQNTGGF